MALPKPSSKPLWTKTNPGVRTEPTAPKKETGWAPNEKPPSEFFNWLFYNIGVEWIEYLESVTDEAKPEFDAYVADSGGTHATIEDAITDLPAGSRIFVADAKAITTTISISKNDMVIVFHPRATYSEGGGAGTGLQIQALRCRILNARLTGFTTGIIIDAGSDNSRVQDCNFSGVTTDITDNNGNSVLSGNMVEV